MAGSETVVVVMVSHRADVNLQSGIYNSHTLQETST